ncbi:MAG: amidohydrolase family protein [Actinomycetes bacterium]
MDTAAIRARLDHPVIDADGHHVEFLPLIRDFLVEDGGVALGAGFDRLLDGPALARGLDVAARRTLGVSRTGWWAVPAANSFDRATAMIPALLHSRLDEIGVDLAVLYPTFGLVPMALDDDDLRRGVARACNRYYAEAYADQADRLLPVAIIPSYNPEEAIAELDHAVGELGLRAVLIGGLVNRFAPGHEGDRAARWVDALGLDSAHDYDPVWRRCAELGVSPTFHSTGIGFGSRTSPFNYVANHIGNFAAGAEAVARSLFFGGVPTRFPELRFAFHEGGVAWAATLHADIISHWKKRNVEAIGHYDPAALDRGLLHDLVRTHGPASFVERIDALDDSLRFLADPGEPPETRDEFAACGITGPADVTRVFTEQFFFGCEADDPMNALAFRADLNPHGARLPAVFASDIGHWDVPDFRGVLAEAWELVEDGLIDEADFRDFTFGNAVRLWRGTNPEFFSGTVVAPALG